MLITASPKYCANDTRDTLAPPYLCPHLHVSVPHQIGAVIFTLPGLIYLFSTSILPSMSPRVAIIHRRSERKAKEERKKEEKNREPCHSLQHHSPLVLRDGSDTAQMVEIRCLGFLIIMTFVIGTCIPA